MDLVVYDLDGTLIDSSHRYRNTAEGSIDLEYWFANATPEKIAQDSLLPLVHKFYRHAMTVDTIICTARTMREADFEFLKRHNMHIVPVLHRAEGDMRSDADLKEDLIDDYLGNQLKCIEDSRVVVYEDNLTVIERLRARGAICSLEI